MALLLSSNAIAMLIGSIGIAGIMIQYRLNFESLKKKYSLTVIFIILMIIGIFFIEGSDDVKGVRHMDTYYHVFRVGLLITALGFSGFVINMCEYFKENMRKRG
ncbi:hypothetical protein [Haloplasma contractile]|uniref:Uncharacterized protein n=1 Tax=Haloplasma contractile SSD-17B TaxID=1033810 RepID=U2FLM1_9MOLU|nr:hypothetical protein [Haloplasma contractile]ERJ12079.1 hypothetical protein HLPCO_001993 [Haloplasma contractile SSD-17B]